MSFWVKTSYMAELKIKIREIHSANHEVKASYMAKTNINEGWGVSKMLPEQYCNLPQEVTPESKGYVYVKYS